MVLHAEATPASESHNPNKPLPHYESMSQSELERFRKRVEFVAQTYPTAGFIGGTAMRIRCDELGLPVPVESSGDFDLTVQYGDKPEPWFWEVNHPAGAIPLDTVDTWTPFREPYYTKDTYQGVGVNVATLPHAFVRKAGQYLSEAESDDRHQKDHLYLEILESLVTPEQVVKYMNSYVAEAPSHIKLDPTLLSFLAKEGFLTTHQAA